MPGKTARRRTPSAGSIASTCALPRRSGAASEAVVAGRQVPHAELIGFGEGEHVFVRRRILFAQEIVHHEAFLPVDDLGLHAAGITQAVVGAEGGECGGDTLDPIAGPEAAAVFTDTFYDELLMGLIHLTANNT